jgi:putative hydrolase of the HAD superfamily
MTRTPGPLKAILFDFGGTIDTDGVHWSEKYAGLYSAFDVQRSKRDIELAFIESEKRMAGDSRLRTSTMRETLEIQLQLQFSTLRLIGNDSLLKSMLDNCYGELQQTIARAGTVLRKLRASYVLGVVSNFYGNLEVVLKEFGLRDLFAAAVDSEVVGLRKPDPAIFTLALDRMEIQPRDAVVVGDSYDRDIEPSKKLGCTTIWLKGKSWKEPETTVAADYTVAAFADILKILTLQ